jgi:hypothetical protein
MKASIIIVNLLLFGACSLKDPTNSRVKIGENIQSIGGNLDGGTTEGSTTSGKDPEDCPPENPCVEPVNGCMHPLASDFSQNHNVPAPCTFNLCLNPAYKESVYYGEILYYRSQYGGTITHLPEKCVTPVGDCKVDNCFNLPYQPDPEIKGCLHPFGSNFNAQANSPGECIFKICQTPELLEYVEQFEGSFDVNPADCPPVPAAPSTAAPQNPTSSIQGQHLITKDHV